MTDRTIPLLPHHGFPQPITGTIRQDGAEVVMRLAGPPVVESLFDRVERILAAQPPKLFLEGERDRKACEEILKGRN